jgi:hypothetical protein
MSVPAPLHRFPLKMAKTLHAAVRRIEREYHGRADTPLAGKTHQRRSCLSPAAI